MQFCWIAYGTGRSHADVARKPLDYWSDTELLEDLRWSDLDVPVLQSKNHWPLPWPEFNRRAGKFLRRRAVRKAAVRGVAWQFRSLDRAVCEALIETDEIEAAFKRLTDLGESLRGAFE